MGQKCCLLHGNCSHTHTHTHTQHIMQTSLTVSIVRLCIAFLVTWITCLSLRTILLVVEHSTAGGTLDHSKSFNYRSLQCCTTVCGWFCPHCDVCVAHTVQVVIMTLNLLCWCHFLYILFMVNIIIIVLMVRSVDNCVNISVLIEGKKVISGTQSH